MKIIATDLDRTLIPNGNHRLSPKAMRLFKSLLKKNKVRLVYVTGRHKKLIEDAILRYNLPEPNYAISDVGTIIYKFKRGKLEKLNSWNKILEKEWSNINLNEIKSLILKIPHLRIQEKSKQNSHKLSLYLDNVKEEKRTIMKIKSILNKCKINYTLVYSVNESQKTGFIDIMPKSGNKYSALVFLLKKLMINHKNVIYSGDSGNDILPLTSGLKGILVKNASKKVKEDLLRLAKKRKVSNKIYLSKGKFKGLNGNYVSGIIEGAYHFKFFN